MYCVSKIHSYKNIMKYPIGIPGENHVRNKKQSKEKVKT